MAKYFSVYLLEGGFEANFKARDYNEALVKANIKFTEAPQINYIPTGRIRVTVKSTYTKINENEIQKKILPLKSKNL